MILKIKDEFGNFIGVPIARGERGEIGPSGGEQGIPGEPGEPGYTPIKGVDYFDGADGAPGEQGPPGEPGEPGEQGLPGEDAVSGDTLPVGAISEWGSDTIPDNYLLANGQAVSRTTYSELFALWGTTFGAGDGSTTFNVLNKKGRVGVGKDASDTDFDTIGETRGSKTHTLTVAEIPAHKHSLQFVALGTLNQQVNDDDVAAGDSPPSANGSTAVSNTGGGGSHNNIQPSIVVNYIIKAKQSAGVVATVVDNLTSTSGTNALSANQGKVLSDKINDGWNTLNVVLTYVGAYTVDTSVDLTSILGIGDKVRITQTTNRYFSIISITASRITFTGGINNVVANDTIVNPCYSHIENPQGFPGYFYYVPDTNNTIGTTGADSIGYYRITGRQCSLVLNYKFGTGLSVNGTQMHFSLPVASNVAVYCGSAYALDVGESHNCGNVFPENTTYFAITSSGPSGSGWKSTIPFTWAAGDYIRVSMTYFI